VDYAGRLSAHLPLATRVLMLKSDGSVLIHSDGGSYKPLNWMSPPCTVREGVSEDGRPEWLVTAGKSDDTLRILIDEVLHDSSHELGIDPGLQKDGVEKHLQELLAEHPATLSDGLTLVRREFMTAIGPVDLMCRDADGLSVAVEIKRRGEIDGVEQLTRYLDLLNRDPALTRKGAVRGIFAAQEIKPQARVLATDRGITCALVDYDALRGMDDGAEPPAVLALRRTGPQPSSRMNFHSLEWTFSRSSTSLSGDTKEVPPVRVEVHQRAEPALGRPLRATQHLDQQVRKTTCVVDGAMGVLDLPEPLARQVVDRERRRVTAGGPGDEPVDLDVGHDVHALSHVVTLAR
jgi:endonuclease